MKAAEDYNDVLRIASAICTVIHVALLIGSASMASGLALPGDDKTGRPKPLPAQGASAQQDKDIEAAIRVKLAKSKIGKDGFKVRVQGGVATWEGSTEVIQHKGAATRMAKSAGARGVVNNIKIGDAAKQSAADNLDQGRRRVQIKRSDPRTQ